MTDLNQSLDTTIAAIRKEHADEIQALRDRTLAAELRAELLQSQCTEARKSQIVAERIAVKLVTQFATVEKVFADAKQLALAVEAEPKVEAETKPEPTPATEAPAQ